MINNDLISIIIPIYNVEKYLSKCLDSIIRQSHRNLEIICIDNGSTDRSSKILNDYASRDIRIQIINTENEGVSIARNKGLEIAKGDYIMFVDSDDWIDRDTCEIALNVSLESGADVVMWSYIREFENKSLPKKIFSEKKVFVREEVKKLHRRFIGLIDEELGQIENADALCPVWGKLYKSSIINDNEIEFIDIRKIGSYEDGLFNLNLFKYVNKAVFIDKYFYHYRKINNNSITSNYNNNLYKYWINLYDIMKKYIVDNQLSNEYRLALKNRISIGIIGLGLNELSSNSGLLKKIDNLNQMIGTEQYRNSIKYLDLKYFPIHWKVFFLCAKYRLSFGLFVLLLCIKKGVGRK